MTLTPGWYHPPPSRAGWYHPPPSRAGWYHPPPSQAGRQPPPSRPMQTVALTKVAMMAKDRRTKKRIFMAEMIKWELVTHTPSEQVRPLTLGYNNPILCSKGFHLTDSSLPQKCQTKLTNTLKHVYSKCQTERKKFCIINTWGLYNKALTMRNVQKIGRLCSKLVSLSPFQAWTQTH